MTGKYRFALWLIRLLVTVTLRVQVNNFDRSRVTGGCVVASNHLGRLDAALVYYFINRHDVTMLIAEKYQKYRIYRWLADAVEGIFVDRFNADFGVLRTCLQRLKAGGVLVLAPEGTRSPTGALIEARSGASFLAAKSGVPIIPVAVTGTEDKAVIASLRRLRRAEVVVRVGEPFMLPPIKGAEREALVKQYNDEIMCRIAAMLPPSYRGFYADHPRLKELLAQSAPSVQE